MLFCHGEYSLCPSLALWKNSLLFFYIVENYFYVVLCTVNLKGLEFLHKSLLPEFLPSVFEIHKHSWKKTLSTVIDYCGVCSAA